MPSPAKSIISPGMVRRFWWRSGRSARLTIAGLGVVTTLATTGVVTLIGDALPGERGGSDLEAAVQRGDSVEVTVHKVSEVDSFEGSEQATGRFFRARVAGVRLITDCWLAESRAAAQDLLRGKNVRLAVRREGGTGSDQIMVDVLLPDGTDYARTVVHDGTAPADPSTREELTPVESAARQDRRGLWATNCASRTETAPPSSTPSSSTPSVAPTTTSIVPTRPESPSQTPPPSPSSPPWTSRPSDDLWVDILEGRRCSAEGERKTSITGREMVCARNEDDELRWRRDK